MNLSKILRRKILFRYHPGGPNNSAEIDEGFNDAIDFAIRRRIMEAEEDFRRMKIRAKEDSMINYDLRGSLYAEDMPIRLDESIEAKDDKEAVRIARKKAIEYRNVEGYGIQLFIFNERQKQIGNVYLAGNK